MQALTRMAARALARFGALVLSLVLALALLRLLERRQWRRRFQRRRHRRIRAGAQADRTDQRRLVPERVKARRKPGSSRKRRPGQPRRRTSDRLLADARKHTRKRWKPSPRRSRPTRRITKPPTSWPCAAQDRRLPESHRRSQLALLQLKPDFYPAIEYRGEALLMTGFIEGGQGSLHDARFRNDRALRRPAAGDDGEVACRTARRGTPSRRSPAGWMNAATSP